jgi:hypothetical protein
MANPNISDLDLDQAMKRCIDADSDALRVEIGESDFAVALSADEGDSVAAYSPVDATSTALTSANTGSATPITATEMDVSLYTKVNVYVQSTTAISSPPTFTLQFSPAASGNVWVSSSLTVVPSASIGVVVMGTPNVAMLAKRVRLLSSAALGGGETATAYILVGA